LTANRPVWRRLALPAWAALLAACAGLPPAPLREAGSSIGYSGRFSLAVTRPAALGPGNQEAWTGRFSLVTQGQTLSLDLVSPLGATIARFETDPAEARLTLPADGGTRTQSGPDMQSLSERVLGWSLPVAGMPDWIAGHPARGRPFRMLSGAEEERVQTDAGAEAPSGGTQPRPERFEQDGWTVSVEPPQGARSGMRLQMERPAQHDAPAVALRVVLDAPAQAAPEPR